MLVAIVSLWCCNGKDTLLDLYPMEPIVNPEVGVLIGDNRIIHIDFDGRQQISGITEAGIFTTPDKFQSLDFEPHAWQATDGVVAFGDGIVVNARNGGASFSLRYSTDNGKTWEAYSAPLLDGRFLTGGGVVSAMQLSISADGSVWLLCQHGTGGDRRMLLYQVHLEQQRSVLMLEKVGATALAFGFADSAHGWVLYGALGDGAGRVHVLRTENGGRFWAEAATLAIAGQPAVAALAVDRLLVYGREGGVFRSVDGGISFEAATVGGPIVACEAASSGTVYALLENGVAKSTDGGHTWTTLDARVHGVEVGGTALDFHGERAGVVYGQDRVFITTNGGQSWDVLVYPYGYVVDHPGTI